MSAALAIQGLTVRAGERALLHDLTLALDEGEVVALLGPSGSGKTTLLRALLGLTLPSSGAVRVGGALVSEGPRQLLPPDQRGLAVVFQDLALWPHFTVRENLAFGLEALRVPKDERAARIETMLERVGLRGKEDRRPASLSGGERQRVAIARALVLKPRAVLLDEPLAHLDVQLKRELLTLFHELLGEGRASAIVVTHDLREAAALATRMVVLESGRMVFQGTLIELRERQHTAFIQALVDDLTMPAVASLVSSKNLL